MITNYAYTPSIWPSVLMALLMISLAVYSGRRRSMPGAIPLMIASLFAAVWAAGSMMEVAAVELEAKIFWFKFQAAWQLPIVTTLTCFILEYTWPGRWLTRRNLALLYLPGLLLAVMMVTNDLHHLVWRGFSLRGKIIPLFGIGTWISLVYAFVILEIVNLIAFGWLSLRSPQHRWPVAVMLLGQFGGHTLWMLDRLIPHWSALPLDLLGISFEFLMYAIALFGFHIFDPISLARQTAIEQMQAGMLVLDIKGRIVSLNPAAVTILGSPVKNLLGYPIQDLLPSFADLAGILQVTGKSQVEISLPEVHPLGGTPGTPRDGLERRSKIRDYQLEASFLNDWRGLEVGSLVLLHDVTNQKRAQAQIIEQQRALAMLQEREQLARELHDGIGQVLGYVKMQAQAARDRLAQDQLAAADSDLEKLVAVAQDAHKDVREYIMGAKLTASDQPGFLPALRLYLQRFSQEYELRTELLEPPGWSDDFLEATVEAQLLRVIQEALTNARKHAQARCVQVRLEVEDSRARVIIQDDGVGFDPALITTATSQKYGLGFMHERAAEVGGCVAILSTPGQGTQVVVEVPVRGVNNESLIS
jgi:signal transduction histidine kinase